MTKKFWKTQNFKALQTKWEEKLRDSGFVDIETRPFGRGQHRHALKQRADNCYRTRCHAIIEAKQRYYELLCQGYHQERGFRDSAEKIVMLLRSRGINIKVICRGLRAVRERNNHDTVRKIIRRYEKRWRIVLGKMENTGKTEGLGVIEIRAYKRGELPEQYLNFVIDRWLKTYKKCNKMMSLVDPANYYHAYNAYIKSLLNRPTATVRIAMLSEDHDVLLGFSVSEGAMLHYVNVPLDYRSQGIARKLVPYVVEAFTHITETGMKLWTDKFPQAKFRPFNV